MRNFFFYLLPASICFADADVAPQNNFLQSLLMIGVLVLFFYFLLWRPEQKRRKSAEEMRKALKKGDKVSAVGIIGIVDKINEQTVILKMIDGNKIEVLKFSITDILSASSESAEN